MKSCPVCGTQAQPDTIICPECLHNFEDPTKQPKRFLVNRELLTVENVAGLCLALMFEHEERYIHFRDLWQDLEAEMTRGSHVVDYGKNMGAAVFSVNEKAQPAR